MARVITQSYINRHERISKKEIMANFQEAASVILNKFKEIDGFTDDELDYRRQEFNNKFVSSICNSSSDAEQPRLFATIANQESAFKNLRQKLKPDDLAVWKKASPDVKRSMLKIKVYDEFWQLFKDEFAEYAYNAELFANIRELVGYNLDTNNFWITWKEQEEILTERLTALAENKAIITERNYFCFFSHSYFMSISLATKHIYNDIVKAIFETDHLISSSPLNEYISLMKQKNQQNAKNLEPRLATRFNTLKSYLNIADKIELNLRANFEVLELIELIENGLSEFDEAFHNNIIMGLMKKFRSDHNIKSVNLFKSADFEVIINSRLKLVFILKSTDTKKVNSNVQIDLRNFAQCKAFFNYLIVISSYARLFKALYCVLSSGLISKYIKWKAINLMNSYLNWHNNNKGSIDNKKVVDLNKTIDEVWWDILLEILPKPAEVEIDENKLALLTKSNYVLDFICEMLKRQLENLGYSYKHKFRQFLNYLKFRDLLTPDIPETDLLIRLVKYILVPRLSDVKRSNEEVEKLKTEINNLLDSKAKVTNSEPLKKLCIKARELNVYSISR